MSRHTVDIASLKADHKLWQVEKHRRNLQGAQELGQVKKHRRWTRWFQSPLMVHLDAKQGVLRAGAAPALVMEGSPDC